MDKYIQKMKSIKAPEPKKLLPWFILILAIVVGKQILGIVKSMFGKIDEVVKGEEEKGQGSGTSQDEVVVDEDKLTYPQNNYVMWADQLEGAFYSTYFSEDDDLAAQILRYMQNDNDVAALVQAYAVRDGGHWWNPNYNLPQLVGAMLDTDLREGVNKNYQSKGMSYRF